jgi:hypothetical protein
MSIQIFNNTLLKILFRQGTDNERRNIIFNSGEPAFTTDTKRLFIGDGVTTGGILAGNLFKGTVTNITSVAPAEIGDTVYNSDTKILYRLKSGTGANIGDWEAIGGKGIDSNTQISIFGSTITNLVSTNRTTFSTLSSTRDANTFYIVTNDNYILM